jgi:PTH1 family peptidyl-tRNA hydrolase
MFYIVGLGNPGNKYDGTRHNIGRDLVFVYGGGQENFTKHNYAEALVANSGECVWIAPETFMNKSGTSVRFYKEKEGAKPEQFILIYDDVDIPVGEVKVSVGRGAGGHNGVADVIGALGSKDFARIRVGIAPVSFWTGAARRPEGGAPMTRHVLGPFSSRERKKIDEVERKVRTIIDTIVTDGIAAAMNLHN